MSSKKQRGGKSIAVLRTSTGTLILEPRHKRATGFGYYVVTWYAQRRAHGTLVGQVPRPLKPNLEASQPEPNLVVLEPEPK